MTAYSFHPRNSQAGIAERLGSSAGFLQGNSLQRAHLTRHSHVMIQPLWRCVIVTRTNKMVGVHETTEITRRGKSIAPVCRLGAKFYHQCL